MAEPYSSNAMYPCEAPSGYKWVWCCSGEYAWFELSVREDEDDEMFACEATRIMVPIREHDDNAR